MMNEAPGPINFTMFLTMFGEKLNGTDPEDVIRNAFACFDEEGTGELNFYNIYTLWMGTVPRDTISQCLQTQCCLLHVFVSLKVVLIKNTVQFSQATK